MNHKPVRLKHHQEWDKRVRSITGGLTIYTPSKGQWISPSGELFIERMIPVRIACSRKELEKIMDITLQHYNQEAVMAYLVSEEVIIKHR